MGKVARRAKVLIVDVAKVSPDDRLVGDLGLGQVDGLEPHHLDAEVQKRFGTSVLGLFERGDPSVRELIDFICGRRSPK